METTRGFTFNNEPNKTAFMIINPKKGNEMKKLRNTIKRGEIGRTNEYEYVGEWYTEKGTHEKSLDVKKSKINFLVNKVKYYGDPYKVGHLALQVRLTIYNLTVIPTIFTNIETWSTVTEKEIEELEKIQREALTSIFELPRSTPYWGLLSELGIWPVEQQMEYKKLTILHDVLTSPDKRLLKEILIDQIQFPFSGCWIVQTLQICEKYNIDINKIEEETPAKFKKRVQTKINEKLEEELKKEVDQKTKMRFCASMKTEKYLEHLGYSEAKMVLKLRLNMTELKCNYKNQYTDLKCNLCKEENDTTEHLFACKILREKISTSNEVRISTDGNKEKSKQLATYIKSALKEKEIDVRKNVRDNLAEKNIEAYHVARFDETELKMVLEKEKRREYQISNFDENTLKMVISCSKNE